MKQEEMIFVDSSGYRICIQTSRPLTAQTCEDLVAFLTLQKQIVERAEQEEQAGKKGEL